jgi:NAD(P)-dependent dehydrogenase (short-subunit alcohol dehydrogenase family)
MAKQPRILVGQVAAVTGGARGIGRETARALLREGMKVAIGDLGLVLARTTATELGPNAAAFELDVTRRDSFERFVDEAEQQLGPVDVLVNNAGACVHRPALEVTDAEWRQVWEVNVDGLWHCSRIVGAQMVERRSGVIVNVGSISAMIVNRPQMQPAYNASKAAVHQLTKSLAAEWAPYGVRVNALAPGYVKTDMAPVDDPRFKRYWIDDPPMQRFAIPEELGPSLIYLASDASSFTTGSVLVADGGYTLW